MKKKVLAGILAATMVFSLAACGSTGSDSDSGSSAASGSTAKTEEEDVYKRQDMEALIRRRLRMCIWVHWKPPKNRAQNLMKLGMYSKKAYAIAYSGARVARLSEGALNLSLIHIYRVCRNSTEAWDGQSCLSC